MLRIKFAGYFSRSSDISFFNYLTWTSGYKNKAPPHPIFDTSSLVSSNNFLNGIVVFVKSGPGALKLWETLCRQTLVHGWGSCRAKQFIDDLCVKV